MASPAASRARAASPLMQSVGRRLRIIFGIAPDAPVHGAPAAAVTPPEIEFVAYAEDRLLTGYVRLGAARLSDLLNDHEEFELVDVHVESSLTAARWR